MPPENTNNPDQNKIDEDQVSYDRMELPGENRQNQFSTKKFSHKKKRIRPPKKILMVFSAIAILGLFGFAGWKLFFSENEADKSHSSGSDQAQQSTDDTEDKPDIVLGKTYTNDFLRLSFKYPESWTVKDENDVILVSSPQIKYEVKDGSAKEGYFKVYIRKQAGADDGKYLGRGYALKQSEKISYSEPEQGQRKETYLTAFGLDNSDNFSYFILQGNFNLAKGDTLGPKFASEVDAYLIAGGFGSTETSAPLATNLLKPDKYSSNQEYLTAVEIVRSLKLK